jgi:hypothetical protein
LLILTPFTVALVRLFLDIARDLAAVRDERKAG